MTVKFSQFVIGGVVRNSDIVVGLRAGDNTQFNTFTGIDDSNGNPLISWSQPVGAGNAVNYINFLSAFTGNTPVISAQGVDVNVNLGLQGQGAGYVHFLGTGAISLPSGTSTQRPASAITGGLRYNSTTDSVEYWSVVNNSYEALATIAGVVTSLNGTANQIAASAPTGTVTLSIPGTFIAPGTIAAVTSVSSPIYLLTGSSSGTISILPQAVAGTYNFNLPTTAGTSGYLLTSAGGAGAPMTWTNPASLGGVTSITGTANQITPSASTGAITLSLPSTLIAPGTFVATTSTSSPSYLLTGSSSGTISILPQAAAGTYNFNLPITAGASGYFLTSGGGGSAPMTWTSAASVTGIGILAADSGSAAGSTVTVSGGTTGLTTTATSATLDITGTLKVANGGTGNTTFTAYSVICAGTTATGVFQNVSGLGSSGQALVSNGAGALPSWQSVGGANANTITVTQTAHGFSVGNWVYLNGSTYTLANDTTPATAEVVGVVSTVIDANDFILTTGGHVTGLSGLTAGTVYFLAQTNGTITSTQETTVGYIDKPLLIADSTTSGFMFNFRGKLIPSSVLINLSQGGTGANLTAVAGGIVYSGASAMAISAAGTSGQIIQSGGTGAPTWTTSTYPATNAINTLLYASSANTMAALATANSSILATNGSGVPAYTTTLPFTVGVAQGGTGAVTLTGLLTGNGTSAVTATAITQYAVLTGGASNAPNSVATSATSGIPLISQGSTSQPAFGTAVVAGGGTGATSFTNTSGLIYANTTTTGALLSLAVPSNNQVLTYVGGLPSFLNPEGATNLLINGGFRVWQRAAGGSASISVAANTKQITADRWELSTNANQACTVSQTVVANQATGEYWAVVQRNSGQTGTGVIRFCQTILIENVAEAIGVLGLGQTLTPVAILQFQAFYNANYSPTSHDLTINIYTGTGTTDSSGIGGGFTGNTTHTSTVALTSSIATYTYAVGISSASTQMAVEFAMTPTGTASTNDSYSISYIQLEIQAKSGNPSQYVPTKFADVLRQCQYYYYKTFLYATAPAQNVGTNTGEFIFPATVAGANTNRSGSIVFPVFMRATPTATTYSPAAASAQVYDETASAVCTGTTVTSLTQNGCYIVCTANASTVVGGALGVHATFDAELT